MADKIRSGPATPVRAFDHQGDLRANIPTAELESFARPEERRPTIVRYPRDPTLDPQLVWKGKDEQDSHDLEVPAVPIYIQETIDPLALIEELRAESEGRRSEQQLGFFGPYTDLTFEEKVDFYRHPGKWSNRMILGDSLLVMTSVAEKEGLKGQVQTIYIDPPYGIRFGSNWQVSTRKRDVKDGKDTDLTRQPEQVRAYRDTWELGIHSYLAYLRDQLSVARELLTESGSVFVQIGDENVHVVRSLLDEVFGTANFVASVNFRTMNPLESGQIESVYDHLVWYAKDIDQLKYRNLWRPKGAGASSEFIYADDASGRPTRLTTSELDGAGSVVYKRSDLISSGYTPSCIFPIAFEGKTFEPRSGKSWRTTQEGIDASRAATGCSPWGRSSTSSCT